MLGKAGEDMRVVMLDREDGQAELMGNRRRIVARMEVAGDDLRRDLEQGGEEVHAVFEREHRAQIAHVADIGRGVEKLPRAERKAVLELAADGEHLSALSASCGGDEEGQRRKPAAAADEVGMARVPVHDAVVRAQADAPVVREDEIRHGRERRARFRVRMADRRARRVAARHHEVRRHRAVESVGIGKEQHLERRVGEHHADARIARRDGGRELRLLTARQQQDGLLVPCEHRLLRRVLDAAGAADGGEVARHDGERFARAVLGLAQRRDRRFVRRVAGEVEAADAFDGDAAAAREHFARSRDGCAAAYLLRVQQVDLRAAVIAADRLRVVAPRGRRVVLGGAGVAHGELPHARALAVVGHGLEDGEARPAGRAVDERVQVAPVRRIVELRAALFTRRDVRRYEDIAALPRALDDGERGERRVSGTSGERLRLHAQDDGALRRLVFDGMQELLAGDVAPLRENLDIGAFVRDAAADAELCGEAADERAEADALHDAVNLAVVKGHGSTSF